MTLYVQQYDRAHQFVLRVPTDHVVCRDISPEAMRAEQRIELGPSGPVVGTAVGKALRFVQLDGRKVHGVMRNLQLAAARGGLCTVGSTASPGLEDARLDNMPDPIARETHRCRVIPMERCTWLLAMYHLSYCSLAELCRLLWLRVRALTCSCNLIPAHQEASLP